MKKLRLLSPVYYITILSIFAVAATAAIVVNRTTQEANRIFAAVVLLGQMNDSLLKSVNGTITYMDAPTTARKDIAGQIQSELTVFDNRWGALRSMLGHIDREFARLLTRTNTISDEFDRFLKIGFWLVSENEESTRSPSYQEFLRLGGHHLQETIALAQSLAQNDYARINKQMERQLNIALGAILVLLLAGAAFARRTICLKRSWLSNLALSRTSRRMSNRSCVCSMVDLPLKKSHAASRCWLDTADVKVFDPMPPVVRPIRCDNFT